MANIIESHTELIRLLQGMRKDIIRAEKGQRAAGIRVRKILQKAKGDILKLRKDIINQRVYVSIRKQRKKAEKNAENTTTK